MYSKILGIILCAICNVTGFYLWYLAVGREPNPMEFITIGFPLGIFCGLVITFISTRAPILVGTASMLVVWFVLEAHAYHQYGPVIGLTWGRFLLDTLIVAAVGAFAGLGYKIAHR